MSDYDFDETYNLEHKQQDHSIEIYPDIVYNDALFQYLTSASYILNNTYIVQKKGEVVSTL